MPKTRKRKHRLDTLFLAIGEAAVVWAYLELAVDLCIEIIHEQWKGTEIEPDMPRTQFARKMRYLRDWHSTAEHAATVFRNFDGVVSMMEQASEHRHRLIHGVAINLRNYRESGIAEMMRRIRPKKERPFSERANYPVAAIQEFRNHVIGLATFMGAFTEILRGDPVSQDHAHQSLSNLFVEMGGFFPVAKKRRHVRQKRR